MNRTGEPLQRGLVEKPGMEKQGGKYRMGEKNSLKLAFVNERLLKAYTGEVSKPSEEAIRLINDTFGDRIKSWTGDNSVVGKGLIETIYSQCLDDGVVVDRSFTHIDRQGQTRLFTESGHAILNRKAMITELKTRVGFKFDEDTQNYKINKNFKILPLDIKGFREADLQGAGDYDLNIFTRQLNLAVEKINHNVMANGKKIDPKDIIVGRYGGDEFYVVIIENNEGQYINPLDTKASNNIKKVVIDTVQSADGFFGKEKSEKFAIKDVDKVDYITLDKMDPVSKMIYLNSLNEALVLGEIELEGERKFVEESTNKIKNYDLNDIEDRESLLQFLGRRHGSSYPDRVIKNKDPKVLVNNKMKYLIKGHDELSLPYILANDLDERFGGNRTEQLLDFYQGYLIDPLLKEVSMSRSDLFSHIKRGEFSAIYAYEVKMKEINDYMSYVYGDNTIRKLWDNRFKDLLRPLVESGKVKVGRIGGMVVVCQTGTLDESEMRLLDDPQQVESEFKGKKEKHEIGYAKIEIPKDVGTDGEIYKQVLDNLFNKPTENWLIKTFGRIINDGKEFEDFIKALTSKEFKVDNMVTMISARYFDSIKRAAKRIPAAQDVLKSVFYRYRKDENQDTFERVDEIRQLLEITLDRISKPTISATMN